jgi:uncharacterized 2Fe-2S/4Fe-4S cluster protein (DUF4445 family)
MITITGEIEYRHGKVSVELKEPSLILDAARTYGLVLNNSCGGKGACGGCAVDLYAGTYEQPDRGEFTVEADHPVRAFGCKTRIIRGPFRISIPRRSLVETGERVVADFVTKEYAGFDPTVRRFQLALPVASLEDTRSDFEHIVEILRDKHQIDLVNSSLTAMRQLPYASRNPHRKITVTIAWIDQRWELLSVEPDSHFAIEPYFGLAVDIGTTTVAMSLVDMISGKIIDTASCYNQQIQKADDVAARIVHAATLEGLEELRKLIVHQTLNPLIQTLCRQQHIDPSKILRMVVSSNTVMWNLFLGIDPASIGAVPFEPTCRKPQSYRARELEIIIFPDAPIDVVPSISAYVGGDIVSDIEASHMAENKTPSLLIDIGTNGEIAIRDEAKMLVTACAAGPAFEGLRISHGMRASIGAIERISINDKGECEYKAIGHAKPVGICSSGLIDFLAEAFRQGLIAPSGRFDRTLIGKNPRLRLVEDGGQTIEYIVAPRNETEDCAQDITVTEKDIETIVQAKGAIFAAIRILLKRLDRSLKDIGKLYLAGGFAKYINIHNAITIGLLPEIDIDRYVIIGNGSLAGAHIGLIDRNAWNAFNKIIDTPQVIELNLDPDFQDEFTFALFIPNYQEELFTPIERKTL